MPRGGAFTIALADAQSTARSQEAITAGLRTFNQQHAGHTEYTSFVLEARDAEGILAGGAIGETAWQWLYVQRLWVDEAHRGRGLGRRILRAAETVARERGCVNAYLSTYDFQARPFYEGQGYGVFGVQEGYPPGHDRFYLRKSLIDAAAESAPPASPSE